MMKVTPDDPVLTAYSLGELDDETRESVSAALTADQELQGEAEAIASLASLLSTTLGAESLTLGDERVAEIHRAGKRPDSDLLVLEHRKQSRRQSFLAIAGVAAVVVVGLVGLSRFDTRKETVVAASDVAGAGAPSSAGSGAAIAGGESRDLPGRVRPEAAASIGLPLTVGRADPSMVERSLEKTGALPARDQFLVANWINLGTEASEPRVSEQGVSIWYEMGPCSWNPSAALLMIRLQAEERRAVEASLQFDPERVKEIRLTGGSGTKESTPAVSNDIEGSRTFLYELDLTEEGGSPGTLRIAVEGGQTREISLGEVPKVQEQSSTFFATAVILGDYARWGASEGRDRETLVRLARSARELLGEVTDESTRYALDMILLSEEALAGP